MRTFRFISIAILAISCFSCGGKKQETTNVTETKVETFVLPDIPVMLQDPEDRLHFLVAHYWDCFDFKDTAYIHKPDILEQAMTDYMDLLPRIPMEDVDSNVSKTLEKASQEERMLEYFIETFRKYLFDPNSPMRNEDLFGAVCRAITDSPQSDEALRSRARHDLKLITMNKVGSKAADFVYTLASGVQRPMSGIKSPYTLLLFYNPDCHGCSEVLAHMKSSPVLNDQEIKKQIQILAFYPDEEHGIWERYQSQIPTDWINSYDKDLTVVSKELYDLKAMPTLYLLDKDKKVLLKDAPVAEIEHYLTKQ
ncbi:DUF5106 domain-containing protein [Phocaeicola sp.]